MPTASFVFPVRYVSEGVAVQTTSRELSPLGISVRSLAPPHVGARVSMALYLPNAAVPEVAIARVARSRSGSPGESGFWADFIVVDPQARMRISHLLSEQDQAEGQHRAYERVPVKLQVRFRTSTEFVQEHAINLSRGGIFIRTDDPPPVDTAVEVELQLPDAGPVVSSAGIVVHRQMPGGVKPPGVGVQFVDASDTFRERMDEYMDSLLKE
ncbi:MAG: TIGR02266 family protein [Myxococcales bacterium]|nr:TIGR02266 family protein [Myxococcales bacterium]